MFSNWKTPESKSLFISYEFNISGVQACYAFLQQLKKLLYGEQRYPFLVQLTPVDLLKEHARMFK